MPREAPASPETAARHRSAAMPRADDSRPSLSSESRPTTVKESAPGSAPPPKAAPLCSVCSRSSWLSAAARSQSAFTSSAATPAPPRESPRTSISSPVSGSRRMNTGDADGLAVAVVVRLACVPKGPQGPPWKPPARAPMASCRTSSMCFIRTEFTCAEGSEAGGTGGMKSAGLAGGECLPRTCGTKCTPSLVSARDVRGTSGCE